MRYWLAAAAKEAREEQGGGLLKPVRVAAQGNLDQSTISRFEKPEKNPGWPRDPDATVAAYALELEMDPRDIWVRAIELWLKEEAPNLTAEAPGAAEMERAAKELPPKPAAAPRRKGKQARGKRS